MGDPLVLPAFNIINSCIGMFLTMFMILGIYYTNTYKSVDEFAHSIVIQLTPRSLLHSIVQHVSPSDQQQQDFRSIRQTLQRLAFHRRAWTLFPRRIHRLQPSIHGGW